MFIEIIISILTLLLLWDYLTKKRRNDMLAYMPGPTGIPLLGNVLMYRNLNPEEAMKFLISLRYKYGEIFRVWIFRRLAVFSCDPKDLEIVLSSPKFITKNNLYELLHNWLGTGLLMSSGTKWHSRRKIITPTFHFKILEQFVDIFDQQSTVMVKKLSQFADGETVINIFPIICLMALDVIAETAMGTKVNAQSNPELDYVQAVTTVANITTKRFIHVWQRIDWLFRLTAPLEYKKLHNGIRILHQFTENIIEKRRESLEESIANATYKPIGSNEDDQVIGCKKRMALLDVLLQATTSEGKPLSNDDIREEVDTFMFEGHDTTTSGISFALYLISRHPEVQKKLYQELCEVLGGNRSEPVNMKQLNDLKYMECVIKESLRLFPSVPFIGRTIDQDTIINDKKIPAGTSYTIGIYVVLRDPKYFPQPEIFNPDRFLNNELRNTFAYIPFSAGPRNCIGQKFAVLEMKSTISKVLRHFELLPLGPEVRPMINLILRSANGVHLALKARE